MAHIYTDSYVNTAGTKDLERIAKDRLTDQATRDKAADLLTQKTGESYSAWKEKTAAGSGSSSMSSSEIMALGQGPLSSTAASKYVATGSTNPTTAYIASKGSPSQVQVVSKSSQETVPAQQQSSYDLTEYLKRQEAAKVESTLAGLKGTYEKSMAGYEAEKANLPKTYNAARNSAAAQSALAQRAFDERAAARGLSSGAAGQADLARSSALTGALSQIDQAQAGAEADIDLQMANLKSQYETAIQQAKANGNSQLATALYQELVRVQGLQRQDEQTAYQRAQSEAQTAYQRAQSDEQTAYQRAQNEAQTAYQQRQTAKAEAQERINAYLAAFGQVSELDSALVEQSGYTPAELTALEQYYANLAAAGTKPTLTADQVKSDIKAGNLTPNVLSAYEYYYGVPYSAPQSTSYSSPSGVSGGVSATEKLSTGTTSTAHNDGESDFATKLSGIQDRSPGYEKVLQQITTIEDQAGARGVKAGRIIQVVENAVNSGMLSESDALAILAQYGLAPEE